MAYAFDTSPRVSAVHVRLYRDLGPAGRAEIMAEMSDMLRDLAIAGVRERHPDYDDDQVLQEVVAVFYPSGRNRR
jgi:hypothetical protein